MAVLGTHVVVDVIILDHLLLLQRLLRRVVKAFIKAVCCDTLLMRQFLTLINR